MDRKRNNVGSPSDLKTPSFDTESERLELDTNEDETISSNVDDCSLNVSLHPAGSDVSEDKFPEFRHDGQGFDMKKLHYNTMTCEIDVKGTVRSCVPVELQEMTTLNEKKMELLEIDIATIEKRLRSFSLDHFEYIYIESRNGILATTRRIRSELSELDNYWNGHYAVTEELNRQINELNHSNTGLCHMNQQVADLYFIYAETKQRLQYLLIEYRYILISWDKDEEFFMKLINWTPSDSIVQNVGPIAPGSESVTSDYKSMLSDSESVASDSESVASDSESVTSASCSDRRSELCIDDDKSDGCESLFNTDIIDTNVAAEKTIAETPLNNTQRFKCIMWIAVMFYLIVMILLWLVDSLEPQC